MENIDPMEKFKPVQMENSITDSLALLFSKDDMETKAIIRSSSSYATLKSLAKEMKEVGLTLPSKTLLKHLKYRLEFSVSEKGKSREQFTDALKSVNQSMNSDPELTMFEKLTTDLKDKK